MSESNFIQDPITKKWVILAPGRAKRPDVAKGMEPVCPFCYGHEQLTPPELYRIGEGKPNTPDWFVRVIPNKYPITKIHELIIHSSDHRKNFMEFSEQQTRYVFMAYKQRFLNYKNAGQVFIFHNHGKFGAESLPHPHSQLSVIPFDIPISASGLGDPTNIAFETDKFMVFCPQMAEWPYEIWIAPKRRGFQFCEIDEGELDDICYLLPKVLRKLSGPLDSDFSYNFYIYPGGDWYLRIIPRTIIRGGFELGTGIMVNTVDPLETVRILQSQ